MTHWERTGQKSVVEQHAKTIILVFYFLFSQACTREPVAPLPKIPFAFGACVAPKLDAEERFGPDGKDAETLLLETVDLDGDGVEDLLARNEQFCALGGCRWLVYLSRKSCAIFIGEIFGLIPIPRMETSTPHRVKELQLSTRLGCHGLARTDIRYAFNGSRYEAYAQRHCRCPKEQQTSNKDEATDLGQMNEKQSIIDSHCEGWERIIQPQ